MKHQYTKTRGPGRKEEPQLALKLYDEKPLTKRSKRELLHLLSSTAVANEPTPTGMFVPSPKQQALVIALAEYDAGNITITKLCKKAGISREAFYSWRAKPGFLEWFNSHRQRICDADIIFVDKVVLNRAKQGELQAARIVYEKRGEMHKRVDASRAESIETLDMESVLRLVKMLARLLPQAKLLSGKNDESPSVLLPGEKPTKERGK